MVAKVNQTVYNSRVPTIIACYRVVLWYIAYVYIIKCKAIYPKGKYQLQSHSRFVFDIFHFIILLIQLQM